MADYISREEVLELIDNAPIIAGSENETLISAPELSDKVYCLPAADVRQVVRGKWVRGNESRTSPIKDSYICSVCGEKTLSGFCGNPAKTSFCPNCGADMRPDKNDQSKEAG